MVTARTPRTRTPKTLEDFFRAVEATIGDAERHLGVLPGTLGDIRHDTDYLAIVKMHATIEPLLNDV
jgi:hypothetical protein